MLAGELALSELQLDEVGQVEDGGIDAAARRSGRARDDPVVAAPVAEGEAVGGDAADAEGGGAHAERLADSSVDEILPGLAGDALHDLVGDEIHGGAVDVAGAQVGEGLEVGDAAEDFGAAISGGLLNRSSPRCRPVRCVSRSRIVT